MQLLTVLTPSMSRPLAATSVATRMSIWSSLKRLCKVLMVIFPQKLDCLLKAVGGEKNERINSLYKLGCVHIYSALYKARNPLVRPTRDLIGG